MNLPALSPKQRLAASRQALVRDMNRGEREEDEAADAAEANEHISEAGLDTSSSSWDLVKQVGLSWWRAHPANLALDVAKPMMQNYAAERPFRLLGIAAGAGVAVMVLRPWRLISLGGLALALIRSTELTGVVQSFLHGERDADRRR